MSDATLDVTQSSAANANAAIVELPMFLKYLKRKIFEDGEETSTVSDAFNDRNSVEVIKKFLSDPQISVLQIQKLVVKDENDNSDVEDKEVYMVSTEISFTNTKTSSWLIIKRSSLVEADKSISSQLIVMNLWDGLPYEALHSIISKAVGPFFKSFIRSTGKVDRDGDKMAPSVEKKIEELELCLLHLQQNIDIPEINLIVHPLVAQMIKKCQEEGSRARVADFGDKVEDAQFLNALHNCVNRWTKEIQKVTKIDRDPSSGTALQEITFWLNLERALIKILEKRETIEITLTLEILKAGKRFHATVSFDSDTGLKPALSTVQDHNMLMKDFPLNELLSATELERIKDSVVLIFNHLKKIRTTKYPILRCLRLIEAISKDLNGQMLKLLSSRRFMQINFDVFDKLISACNAIFHAWDEEFDKLHTMLREIAKKEKSTDCDSA